MEQKTRLTALSTPSLPTPTELGCGLKVNRDYVMLALLVGAALRRDELAELEIEAIQKREGKWVLNDLEDKGRRICDNPTRILAGGVVGRSFADVGVTPTLMTPAAK
jgi:integrase